MKKIPSLQHAGPCVQLLLHIVVTQIKAHVTSSDQVLITFVERDRRQAFQPVLQIVFYPLVTRLTRQTLASQKLLGVDKQVIVTRYKFKTVWRMLEDFPLELLSDARERAAARSPALF